MTSLQLRQDRADIVKEMRTFANSTAPADVSRWKELNATQEQLRLRIEQDERTSEIESELAQVRGVDRPSIGELSDGDSPLSRVAQIRASKEYKKEFWTYVRSGKTSKNIEEFRALGAASGADGATLVPQGFEDELIIKLKAYGGVTRLCRSITTSTGNPLPWPNLDDTTNTGEWLTEGSPTTNADPTFSNVVLGANLLSSKQVKLSVQLEQDSAFPMDSVLSDMFAKRLGRTSNLAFTQGDGTSTYGTITGLIPALVAAGGRSVLAVGGFNNSGNSADTDLNTIGTDDIEAVVSKVDPAYRNNLSSCAFAANMISWDKLKVLKDKFGRPIWQTSLAVGVPDSIMGYKFDWNMDISQIGAGNISLVFGDWSNFVVRNVLGFTFIRFNELYMANYQRAYQAFARMDGKLLQSAAFSYLIHPLS